MQKQGMIDPRVALQECPMNRVQVGPGWPAAVKATNKKPNRYVAIYSYFLQQEFLYFSINLCIHMFVYILSVLYIYTILVVGISWMTQYTEGRVCCCAGDPSLQGLQPQDMSWTISCDQETVVTAFPLAPCRPARPCWGYSLQEADRQDTLSPQQQ